MTPLASLEAAGRAAYGDAWQRPMARLLGEERPGGGGPLDDRLLRRWVAGERPVPDWVPGALPGCLRRLATERMMEARRLAALADRLDGGRNAEGDEAWHD